MGKFIIICLICALAGSCQASDLPKTIVPQCLGVNIHFTGAQEAQVQRIAEGGFRFIRMDCAWAGVEGKKGEYDFKEYDELVASLTSRGLRALLILDYGNPLYDENLAPRTDAGRAAFARFAGAAAARFKGKGVLWEIWNEPNHPTFWKPGPSAQDYVKLAQATCKAIKKADPDATVLAPALSGWDFGFLESLFKLGLLDCTDVVSVHPYGSAQPEDAARYYASVRALISRYAPRGKDIPVVSGEWGYASVGQFTVEKQAQFLARQSLFNMLSGIPLSIWYDWHNDGADPADVEHNCGTLNFDYSEKPAYKAAQTLAKELDGYGFASRISADSDDDYLALFGKGDDFRLAAWTSAVPHAIRIPVDVEDFDIVSLTGEKKRVQARSGMLDLTLTGAVQYVEPVEKSKRWKVEAGWNVSATVTRDRNLANVELFSRIFGGEAETSVSGPGVATDGKKEIKEGEKGIGWTTTRYIGGYVSSGEPKGRVVVTVRLEDFDKPFTKVVEMDASICPVVTVLPPSEKNLLVAVEQSEAAPAFEGKLMIGNSQGIRLSRDSADVKLPAGAGRAVLEFPMTQPPAAMFSFSCRLLSKDDTELVRLPARRYSVVKMFSEGKPGDMVSGCAAELSGDAKAPGEVKMAYAESPKSGPNKVCVKLDYKLGPGWKFAQVMPKPRLKIVDRPTSARLWVKGEGKEMISNLRFVGSDGQFFQESFGRLNFDDWRCLEAEMTGGTHWGGRNDGTVSYPIEWDTLLLVDNPGSKETKGTVYFGTLMLCYD